MFKRSRQWIKEISADIIEQLITARVITSLSTIHFISVCSIWQFIENNYLMLISITLNIILLIVFYKKDKTKLRKKEKVLSNRSQTSNEPEFIPHV